MTETQSKRERLLDRANRLPLSPGVYIMKDRTGKIIYIGKSKVLKQRVSSYFQEGARHNLKTQRMTETAETFDYILCDNEIEALTLENRLIKLHQPKFNIKLKDSKTYPYIRITDRAAFPQISVVRGRKADDARYFGPYSGSGPAYAILHTIQKTFGIPSCRKEFPRDIGKERPCLYYQLGQCYGICTGKVTSEEYKALFGDIISLLRGGYTDVRSSLTEKMSYASDNLMFEAAALYRDRIAALEKLWQRQKVVGSPETEQDAVALYTDDLCSCLTVFYIRSGSVTDSEHFIFPAEQLTDGESIVSFLCDLYTKREYIPKEILINLKLEDEYADMLTEFISQKAGYRVKLRRPERGEARALCELVYENAKEYASQYQTDTERDSKVLIRLAQILALEVVPQRIEAYDISNIGAEHTTAGMVTAVDARFRKSDYRIFNIRGAARDDYAAMREAVSRRLEHSEPPFPDLILVDGGRGHVAAVRSLLAEKGVTIPVFGMVKDEYHKTRALSDEHGDISIAREQSVFQFIYKLQEEVHRFTVSRMSAAKSRTLKHTSLEDIAGIGPAKAKRLLRHFGSIARIREADTVRLCEVGGITQANAEAIRNYFSGMDKE